MLTTDKYTCRALAAILHAHGVKHAVVSPGSRNAPIITALSRYADGKAIKLWPVVDERSAGFIALGIALATQEPVALVCTSGSAPLNYAPALAEAYYRQVPLIAVSADRPREWIDQADSQTIRQPGALANVVKRAYDLADADTPDARWMAERDINDAMLCALDYPQGPVHINLQLREPLGGQCEPTGDTGRRGRLAPSWSPEPTGGALPVLGAFGAENFRVIRRVGRPAISDAEAHEMARKLRLAQRPLIVAGYGNPSAALDAALTALSSCNPALRVVAEPIANINAPCAVSPEQYLAGDPAAPDLLITIGGALVSKQLKQRLRQHRPAEHWHIGPYDRIADTYHTLTAVIDALPSEVMAATAGAAGSSQSSQSTETIKTIKTIESIKTIETTSPLGALLPFLPRGCNLQLSNGLTVRQMPMPEPGQFHRVDCNRGVSGIDGSTSTAVGMSMADTERVTILVTGDMSAAYDLGALACMHITARFKMAVINNGGAGIFRRVESTRSLPERDELFVINPPLPLRQLAEAYGFAYFRATADDLNQAAEQFVKESERPAILEIVEPTQL